MNRILEFRKRELRRASQRRSYRAKIERGECGHCSAKLDPSSKSCCTYHLSFFRSAQRKAAA